MLLNARRFSPLLILLLFPYLTIGAQEAPAPKEGGALPIESEWTGPSPALYNRGDQTFIINLGTVFPLFLASGNGASMDANMGIGGAGSLNYNYYFNGSFALGGEFGGMFTATIGQNMFFIMPFGLKLTYQFIAVPFEFPLSLMIGAASQSYLESNYFGLFVKPGVSFYWRYSPDWSFGVNAQYWWVPQWTSDEATTVFGNFLETTISARYHF